ncbi:DUF86 domain-containing protein [Roseateles sp. LYH14W]|uniref:DUF86 domain-containing protein n=1 Tax=Pelomonas parva TaxID=3299032 RepID=A0ABW7F0C9_9BURK
MSERDTRLYIEDMLEFCGKALAYSSALTEATLTAEAMRYDAILRNLELIGEAATHVPEALRAMAPDVPWRQIVATRNRVAHAYLGISADTVWSILHDDLPALDLALRALLTRMNEGPPATGR